MPISGIAQPEYLVIDDTLRLIKYTDDCLFALEWYQDPQMVLLVDGEVRPYDQERLYRMYHYLQNRGEVYFIEARRSPDDVFEPIGDVAFWQEDMPIVIGKKEWRGRGIGGKVIRALIERARWLGYTHLKVREIFDYNIASRKLFEEAGFCKADRTEKGSGYRMELHGESVNLYPVTAYEECRTFVESFFGAPDFSDPMLCSSEQLHGNLLKGIEEPGKHRVLAARRGGNAMIGIFSFLVLPEEKYLEMLVGLSRDRDAWEEIFAYLVRNYPGFDCDFVFNPRNTLLDGILREKGAFFHPEQQKLVLKSPVLSPDISGVELLSEGYTQQYFEIHNKDMYWTGERVAAAQDRFRTFLAIRDGKVVGYMDVTCCFEENEPFDLYVLPEYRRRGYGRKLLTAALRANHPKSMMLLVDVDNLPALALYTAAGFAKDNSPNYITAHWKVG